MRVQTIQVLTRALADKQAECDAYLGSLKSALRQMEGMDKQMRRDREKAKRGKADIFEFVVEPLKQKVKDLENENDLSVLSTTR